MSGQKNTTAIIVDKIELTTTVVKVMEIPRKIESIINIKKALIINNKINPNMKKKDSIFVKMSCQLSIIPTDLVCYARNQNFLRSLCGA